MDLLRACDDLKSLIETAQKLIETWDEDPDNYSKLEQHRGFNSSLGFIKDQINGPFTGP